jgi:hypothetical protein
VSDAAHQVQPLTAQDVDEAEAALTFMRACGRTHVLLRIDLLERMVQAVRKKTRQ